MDTISQAVNAFRRGDIQEAQLICRRRLAADSDDADTHTLLGEIDLSCGRHASAVVSLSRAVALRSTDAAVHRKLAGALLAGGRADDAVTMYRRSIVIDPGNTRAHNNLGQALLQMGLTEEAKAAFQAALRLDPHYAVAHNNLGMVYTAAGDFERAIDCFRCALESNGTLVPALLNLAIALESAGRIEEALQGYDAALATSTDLHQAWIGRASALSRQQRFGEALSSLAQALHQRPGDVDVLTRKVSVLLAMERTAEALRLADEVLRRRPDQVDAHRCRAKALRSLGRRRESLDSLDAAILRDPTDSDSWSNRGIVQHELGESAAAIESLRRAVDLDPAKLQARTRLLARTIPAMPQSLDEIVQARAAFDGQLRATEEWLGAARLNDDDAFALAQQQLFYLSYDDESNRSILERYRGEAAARLSGFDLPDAPRRPSGAYGSPFKLGFVSAHVFDHSVYNAILRGWVKHLDHARFEISVFSLGTREDALTREARESVDHFDSGARSIQAWARTIGKRGLDALIYPEIGMNETTLSLASLRLAPRQYVAWGHPETSGLPTMDGYLSAELFEPASSQEHYTEILVPLPNLGVHYTPFDTQLVPVDEERLGIPASNGPRFICPGVPFKYRPQHDKVFVEIARRLGRCTFVFFDYEIAELSRRLQARISAEFQRAGLDPKRHLVWIAWQSRAAFLGLLRQADVYLDTLGFSGFNTAMQAAQCRLPSVTLEGRFMRGRLGSGIHRRLQMPELIASDTQGYVDIAVRLATDTELRSAVGKKLHGNETSLYDDRDALRGLEAVLLDPTRVQRAGVQ